jgi:hypothetical protein
VNSKFKIQTGIQHKVFRDFEWYVYLRRAVLVELSTFSTGRKKGEPLGLFNFYLDTVKIIDL